MSFLSYPSPYEQPGEAKASFLEVLLDPTRNNEYLSFDIMDVLEE